MSVWGAALSVWAECRIVFVGVGAARVVGVGVCARPR